MANELAKLWYPPPFKDPELSNALKAAFDLIYETRRRFVRGGADNIAIASGSSLVTGSSTLISTGLDIVTRVLVSINNEDQPLNEWPSGRPSPFQPGRIDLYVWMPTAAGDNTPIASITQRTVNWIAVGTKAS